MFFTLGYSLLIYFIHIVQIDGTSTSQRMNGPLSSFKSDSLALISELEGEEQWLEPARKPKRKNLDNLNKKLKNFYNYIGNNLDIEHDEYWENQPQWINLSEEYRKKFRMKDIFYYFDILEWPNREIKQPSNKFLRKEMPKIITLIGGLRAEFNTFLLQIEMLRMEDELEKYTKWGDELALDEEWAKLVTKKMKPNDSSNNERVGGNLQNEHEQMEIFAEYRKNVEIMLGILLEEISKMRKEIADNRLQIYFTERPFKEAENRLTKLESDRNSGRTKIDMSDLKRILNMLFAESRLELLKNEFESMFEEIKFEFGKDIVDWRAFWAVSKIFEWNWNEIEERIGHLSAEDQREIQMKMEQIREATKIKVAPTRAIILAEMEGIAKAKADLDMLMSDMITPTNSEQMNEQEIGTLKRFYDRATKLCDNLDKLHERIGIWSRKNKMPNEIRENLDLALGTFLLEGKSDRPWEKRRAHEQLYKMAKENLPRIKRMVQNLEGMKKEVERAFIGEKPVEYEEIEEDEEDGEGEEEEEL